MLICLPIGNYWVSGLHNLLLTSPQRSRGNKFSSSNLVFSGPLLLLIVLTQRNLLVILCTCVSTHIPSVLFHAIVNVKNAIFGPTPYKKFEI